MLSRHLQTSALLPTLLKLRHQTLAVAWSGGVDSTALLLMLKQAGFRLQAWHIDHAWHAHSAAHATTLQALAEQLAVPFFSRRLPSPSGKNREAEARQRRYAMWQAMASEHGVRHMMLAHHADDQAETVCMRMLQGAGVQGCCGMAAQRRLGAQLTLYRPLLHIRKQQLQQLVTSANIPVVDDPSNQDTSLRRNYIRHRLFPTMQGAGHDPCKLYLGLQRQAWRYWRQIEQSLARIPLQQCDEGVSMNWHVWIGQSAAVRAALLQRMMSTLHGEGRCLGRRHILLAEQWLQQGGNNGIDLAGCRLSHRREQLLLQTNKKY